MPNWCITDATFKGKRENIHRLDADMKRARQWTIENPGYCNVSYFLSLSGFDTVNYVNRYNDSILASPSFRGKVVYSTIEDVDDDESTLLASFEMAWYTHYELIKIISQNYNVGACAYSEEPSFDIFTSYSDGDLNYDYDIVVRPDYDQAEEYMKNNPGTDVYYIPYSKYDTEYNEYIDFLNKNNIDYDVIDIEKFTPNDIQLYGVYYEPVSDNK